MVIITAGMIGVGKTTLTELIAEHFDMTPGYEPVGDNPVLPLYYANPKQYGFLLQIFFLNRRFAMIKQALTNDHCVLDRSIYEDALFTTENYHDGNISATELTVYNELLANMMAELQHLPKQAPDLLVYAHADFDTILTRIQKRGRDYEQCQKNDPLYRYYRRIWEAYHDWYSAYSASAKIAINLAEYDLTCPTNQAHVLSAITAALNQKS